MLLVETPPNTAIAGRLVVRSVERGKVEGGERGGSTHIRRGAIW